MGQEAVQAFVERVNDDETFRDGLIAADGNDARLRIAQEAGFDITAEDFEELRSPHAQELSEDDLADDRGWARGTGGRPPRSSVRHARRLDRHRCDAGVTSDPAMLGGGTRRQVTTSS